MRALDPNPGYVVDLDTSSPGTAGGSDGSIAAVADFHPPNTAAGGDQDNGRND